MEKNRIRLPKTNQPTQPRPTTTTTRPSVGSGGGRGCSTCGGRR